MCTSPFFKDLRGVLTQNAPIGQQSWFGCGGNADVLFEPADEEDLLTFLQHYPPSAPLSIIGGLANTIVRDGGVRGVTLRLGKAFAAIETKDDTLSAGAGALNGSLASQAAKAGLGGLEFLSGIPGSVGGALAMNAGAYGAEVKDVLLRIHGITRAGQRITLQPDDLKMSYRRGNIPADVIVTRADFIAAPDDRDAVKARLKAIKDKRNATQPIRENTGGSTFANPSADLRAWQVVEQVGGRDLKIGGAAMSPLHCNFMINDGSACAADLEALGDELIRRAKAQGVALHWEIKRIGEPAK